MHATPSALHPLLFETEIFTWTTSALMKKKNVPNFSSWQEASIYKQLIPDLLANSDSCGNGGWEQRRAEERQKKKKKFYSLY